MTHVEKSLELIKSDLYDETLKSDEYKEYLKDMEKGDNGNS